MVPDKDQKRMGPYDVKTLQKNPALISEKIHLVWREGLTTWLPVAQVPELAKLVNNSNRRKKALPLENFPISKW